MSALKIYDSRENEIENHFQVVLGCIVLGGGEGAYVNIVGSGPPFHAVKFTVRQNNRRQILRSRCDSVARKRFHRGYPNQNPPKKEVAQTIEAGLLDGDRHSRRLR
jgi:hypothetical protein